MSNEKIIINEIKEKWIERKKDKDFWEQFQGISFEVSQGIYSEDNHFIYELIQNAEDTTSNEKEHILEFTLEENGLIVSNNEIGFSEKQINAICAFKKSTKALEKNEGFIGEKGIGFKSVFKITDKPAIFSNRYKFYFNRLDETGTTTEYIIPHWINDDELKKYPLEFQNNTHTTLYLPFSQEKKQEKITKLKEDIKHIEPILLLFLKKLNNIKINESGAKVINTRKTSTKDQELELVTIQNKDTLDKYYMFHKSIDVNPNIDEVKDKNGRRKDIKKREIILAFPHYQNKTKEDRIFSFLPTKLHSELNFIIQADFILQSGRENIAIDNEWNQWQFDEIEQFICNKIFNELKNHDVLKFSYLNYFLKNGDSHNQLIEKLYKNILGSLKDNYTILSDKETWNKPNNIILVEDDIKIETKYLKLLFGQNYEQVHSKFKLDNFFIDKLNIKKVNKQVVIEAICDYFDKFALNDYGKDTVLELTKFLAKNLSIDSRSLNYEKELFERVKKSLPVLPKYLSSKNFYLYDAIHISSEYEPEFIIESLAEKDAFDFTQYNFLSDNYLDTNNKQLENFIRKIIEEQKEHKNQKTLRFLTNYPTILQNYLIKNIKNHYKKVLDFLINILEDNINKISKIPLLLAENGEFHNSEDTIYFSNESKSDLKTLNKKLFELIYQEKKYKEFLSDVFKVKEADIINIILNENLPWIEKNHAKRNSDNDKKILQYTKTIIENFDRFENEQKKSIKEKLYFISSNQENKYLKSSNIYLSNDLSNIVFEKDSIENYITDVTYFDFLNDSYQSVLEQIDEVKIEEFFKSFSFKQNIKEDDILNFIKFIKDDLSLSKNIEALELIIKSIDNQKFKEIENFKVYSQNQSLFEIKNIFHTKIDNLNMNYIDAEYKKRLTELYFKPIKHYFQSEYNLKPFIKYLREDISFNEALFVYKYLDSKSKFNPNTQMITHDKIRQAFKKQKLIYDENSKTFYPTDVTWKEEKSANKLFAISTQYPPELENFFVKTVQISQTKDIRQIINQINDKKEKNDDYFNLLIDLNDLVVEDNEIDKYDKSFNVSSSIHGQYDEKNIYENAKQFILKQEKIFILDNCKKNKDENFYFNDLEIVYYHESLENKIFSINEKYPINYYKKLIDSLSINKLSSIKKEYFNRAFHKTYSIDNYRKILNFAYDLLFTRFSEEYKKLEDREEELKEINSINVINIYNDIITNIKLENTQIEIEGEKYYFKDKTLHITDEKDLFKIIAKKIWNISDKDIKDFYREVINGNQSYKEYYQKEEISQKQNFPLEISDFVETNENQNSKSKFSFNHENGFDFEKHIINNEELNNNELSAEEQRANRQKSGAEQVKGYNNNVINSSNETSPSILKGTDEFHKQYRHEKTQKLQNISQNSKTISPRTKRKITNSDTNNREGEEDTKLFFRQKDQYLGQCQICGFTFRAKNNINYCERFTWTDYKKIKIETLLVDAGNSLCLCAKCHSVIKGGGDFEATFLKYEILEKFKDMDYNFDTFIEDINSDKLLTAPECFEQHIEFNDMYFMDIRLNNNDERIYFTEEHLIMFFEFLKE